MMQILPTIYRYLCCEHKPIQDTKKGSAHTDELLYSLGALLIRAFYRAIHSIPVEQFLFNIQKIEMNRPKKHIPTT